MIIVGKNINDISLNPLEYLLDVNPLECLNEDEKIKEFESKSDAIEYLKSNGFTDDAIECLEFIEIEKSAPAPTGTDTKAIM